MPKLPTNVEYKILEVSLKQGQYYFFQFCVSVHHIMTNKNTSLMQLISMHFTYSKSLHVSGRILPIMHGNTKLKFIDAKQAKDFFKYKNTKRKLYKVNSAIWYNKTCTIAFPTISCLIIGSITPCSILDFILHCHCIYMILLLFIYLINFLALFILSNIAFTFQD